MSPNKNNTRYINWDTFNNLATTDDFYKWRIQCYRTLCIFLYDTQYLVAYFKWVEQYKSLNINWYTVCTAIHHYAFLLSNFLSVIIFYLDVQAWLKNLIFWWDFLMRRTKNGIDPLLSFENRFSIFNYNSVALFILSRIPLVLYVNCNLWKNLQRFF